MLEQGSIDNPLTFDVGLIQLSFIPVCSLLIHATFQSNCAEGLHFSAFINRAGASSHVNGACEHAHIHERHAAIVLCMLHVP